MITIIILLALIMVYAAYYLIGNAKFLKEYKKYKKQLKEFEASEEYKEWKSRSHYSNSVSSYAALEKNVCAPSKNGPEYGTMISHMVGFIVTLIIAMMIVGGLIISSREESMRAMEKSRIYQDYVNGGVRLELAADGYEPILEWNIKIAEKRFYANHWYFKWYHIADAVDWNEVPQVVFPKK